MNAVSHTSYTSDCATQVPDAIEHMYAGKNTGKVTVTLAEYARDCNTVGVHASGAVMTLGS